MIVARLQDDPDDRVAMTVHVPRRLRDRVRAESDRLVLGRNLLAEVAFENLLEATKALPDMPDRVSLSECGFASHVSRVRPPPRRRHPRRKRRWWQRRR